MKKNIIVILLLLAAPMLVHSVTEDGITIKNLSMEPVPFNERRDPLADSPYNAFDGDIKSAALYSDFTMEFAGPVTIDQIKIVNGNASDKEHFKKNNRERDIEIILYTVAIKPDKEKTEKKKKKTVTSKPKSKIIPAKDKDKKDQDIKSKTESSVIDKIILEKDKVKTEPLKDKEEKIKDSKDKVETDKTEKEKKEKKKIETPEKVVNEDNSGILNEYLQDDTRLYFTASETVLEPEKENEGPGKADKTKPVKKDEKKTEKKKSDKKNLKNLDSNKTKVISPKKSSVKILPAKTSVKTEKTPVKEQTSGKNIIEIFDSKKDLQKTGKSKEDSVPDKKINENKKEDNTKIVKEEKDKTVIKKELAAADNGVTVESKKSSRKIKPAEKKKEESKKSGNISNLKKKNAKQKIAPDKKTADKTPSKKKSTTSKDKSTAADKNIKKEQEEKKIVSGGKIIPDKNKIEIIESKDKTSKTSLPVEDKKIKDRSKILKPADEQKNSGKSETGKKPIKKKEAAKDTKTEVKKEVKKQTAEKKLSEEVVVQKMKGVIKIENDSEGRVFVYASLKDSMEYQTLDLKGKYAVTKIDFRTRDDEYYIGSEPDRSAISEIAFLNNGKKIPVQGIDALKKVYTGRYSKTLSDSLSGETFLMYENSSISLRMKFKKDGGIEYFDRFKCAKKDDADCTSLSMPDRWRVTDGILYMRYHTLWRIWKYELDSQDDMVDGTTKMNELPRWMKIYYKSGDGFTDKYLDLVRSEKGVWAE